MIIEPDEEVPGCTLRRRSRGCSTDECSRCGFNEQERNRRSAAIRQSGLSVDSNTGLRKFVIPKQTEVVPAT